MKQNQKLTLTALSTSASWFTIIGAIAALVHYVVAVGLERWLNSAPSWANLLGFLCAFPVSYFGHRTFSFVSTNIQHRQALPKFLLVAIGGFIANQTMVLMGLRYTALPFWVVLGVVMVIVAMSTYVLSRYWAFKAT